jgi:hypothetical protein
LEIFNFLKFPNGQFPLKIPGPISQATLEQNKKNKKKFTRGGVYTWVGKGYFSEWALEISREDTQVGLADKIGNLKFFAHSEKYPFPTHV